LKTTLGLFLVTVLAGCMTEGEQLSGSQMTSDANGKSSYVTYVTPEEYQRMTPDERNRLNATVGTTAPLFPQRKKQSERVSDEKLDELYPKEK
jgi:hypothetical protein